MTIGSNNPFPSILAVEGTTPASPSAGQQRLFVRSSDHVLCLVNSSGTVTSLASQAYANPMTTANDLIIGGASGVATRLATVASKVLSTDGSGVISWASAGAAYTGELDYVQITSPVSVTATTDATANTVLTGTSVAYDGATPIFIHVFAPYVSAPAAASGYTVLSLWDGATQLGYIAVVRQPGTSSANLFTPVSAFRRLTPSNASHQYIVKAIVSSGTGTIEASAGGASGSGDYLAAFIRITKAA